MPEEKDQVAPDSKEEKTEGEQSNKEEKEKQKEEGSGLEDLVHGLQKGYTQSRQDLSSLRNDLASFNEKLDQIAEAMNNQSGAKQGEEEYVTAGSLRKILAEERNAQSKAMEKQRKETETYIERTITEFYDSGIISSKTEEDALIKFAIDNHETDLRTAAAKWLKANTKEKVKDLAKKTAHKQESSEIGTKKSSGQEQAGVNIKDVREKDWSELPDVTI